MPTPTALQLPPVREPAEKTGGRTYRKQVLPLANVEHPEHGRLEFTPATLRELVDTFNEGAMDQVAFTLVDNQNRHVDSPELFRARSRAFELVEDGLDAIIEASDRGAQLLEENPRLPVSVRIKVPEVGPFAGRLVLAHVAGTPDPVAPGMRPWQGIDASGGGGMVVDLSGGQWDLTDVELERVLGQAVAELDAAELAEAAVAQWEGRRAPEQSVEFSVSSGEISVGYPAGVR